MKKLMLMLVVLGMSFGFTACSDNLDEMENEVTVEKVTAPDEDHPADDGELDEGN